MEIEVKSNALIVLFTAGKRYKELVCESYCGTQSLEATLPQMVRKVETCLKR